jgi:hypothetical protein
MTRLEGSLLSTWTLSTLLKRFSQSYRSGSGMLGRRRYQGSSLSFGIRCSRSRSHSEDNGQAYFRWVSLPARECCAWANISQPGQHVEMTMLFAGTSYTVDRPPNYVVDTICPGCYSAEARPLNVGESVLWYVSPQNVICFSDLLAVQHVTLHIHIGRALAIESARHKSYPEEAFVMTTKMAKFPTFVGFVFSLVSSRLDIGKTAIAPRQCRLQSSFMLW